nr:hypothetical protein [Rhizohabitans arisaemae]
MAGYLTVLRSAMKIDQLRREAEKRERARRQREQARRREQERRREQAQQTADIIDLSPHLPEEPYDQYEDARRRAVGD